MSNKTTILVVDDDELVRQTVAGQIQETPCLRTGWQVKTLENIHPCMVVESIAKQIMFPRDERPAVVVLDLALGRSATDGLAVIRSLRHTFDGVWVIHSDTFFKEDVVREETLSLGVRFAARKLDGKLGEIVHAVLGLADEKRLITSFAYGLLTDRMMLDYPQPTDLRELLLKLLRIGHEYNGSDNPIPWAEVMSVGEELMAHARAQQEYAESRLAEMPEDVWKSSESYMVRDVGVLLNAMANFTMTLEIMVKNAKLYLIEDCCLVC